MAAPLNIYQRINEIRKSANYAQREKEVGEGGHSYKAVTHDQITAMLRNHLIEHAVVVVPALIESSVSETGGKTAKGALIIRYSARYEVAFVNGDNPEERIVVVVEAHGNDSGDKAPGKTMSYAVKYAMLKLFSIETGENEESRTEEYGDFEVITDAQAREIERLVEERVPDRAIFAKWLLSAVGADIVREIPSRKYELVVKQLESAKKKDAPKDPAPANGRGGKKGAATDPQQQEL